MAQRKGTGEPLMTLDGTVAGTPSYMPPEQARGEVDKLDRRSDIYALGAILYEMLTLTPPYVGEDGWAVLDQVVAAKLVPPTQRTPQRKIPWELSAVAERALAASQRDRYESVSELKQEIEAFLQGGVLKAADYSTWQVARKWALRHKPAVVAAALILLTVVAAFIGISGQLRKAQEARLEALARSSEAMAARGQETRERLKAQANERRARASKRDFEQLADVQAMRELQAGAAAMWPRRSGLIGQYRDWLDKARELTGKRSVHEATVARLRQLPQRNPGQKVLLSALAQLVRDIDRLKQHHPRGDTIAGIVARLAFAQRLEQLWKADSAAWETARKSISRLPVYAKLKLQPIRGLVPLGPDAATGLWEFAHRGSGEVPRWDTNSKLRITGDTGLVLVLIPPGSFHMGSHRTQNPNKDPQSLSSERPVRRVTLAAFLLSKYEMTQAQWQRATGWNRSTYHPDRNKKGQPRVRAHNPVTNLGWFECRRTLGQLGLQLPTEAQWEYAGRAGTQTPWHCGDKVADLQGWANIGDESARGRGGATWSLELSLKDGHVIHAPVGSFRPNRWGLFDMLGNVREWCRDPYLRDYSVVPRRGDGLREVVNPEKNSQFFKVARGGSYKRAARSARVAHRWRHSPGWHGDDMGVRPVLNLVDWDPQAK